MLNKDVVHPKMKRKIVNPRICLLDCNLEYKKGESQTNIEMTKETDFAWVSFASTSLFIIYIQSVSNFLVLAYWYLFI